MNRIGVVLDPRYTRHTGGRSHPERPDRIEALIELLEGPDFIHINRLDPRPATTQELAANHDLAYIRSVEATAGKPYTYFDADTRACEATYETALLAAGGTLTVVDAIMAGVVDTGFAMVRPPGHHAENDHAMGFCFFNNVAIAARHLRRAHSLDRVMILDWDVHHGNGTQHSFYKEENVLYISLHQSPLYPGTGAAEDVGTSGAEGRNVNIPLPAGCGDAEYRAAFERIVEPIARQFDPQFVLISAGMDCHNLDPLGGMKITGPGFAAMTRSMLAIAGEHAMGRCAAVLEGGYSMVGLVDGVAHTLTAMHDDGPTLESPPAASNIAIERARSIQSQYWKLDQ